MPQTVLLGHPRYFRILHGANPHTRDRWGRRKVVDRARMWGEWERLRQSLLDLGVRVLVLPSSVDHPGAVFPANAGLWVSGTVYLSRLNPARAGEGRLYASFLQRQGFHVAELSGPPFQWEGEADTFPVGDPSGDPARVTYLFTYGRLTRPHWVMRWGWPPYAWVYGFRTDLRVLAAIRRMVAPHDVIPIELVDERYYHGDTCLCAFGPHREFLLVYLPALAETSRQKLTARFGDRLLPIDQTDAEAFAANAYQVDTAPRPTLLITHRIRVTLQQRLRDRGVDLRLMDVSEFMDKGGGSVKCLLLQLGGTLHG